jgi:hypothetical protein
MEFFIECIDRSLENLKAAAKPKERAAKKKAGKKAAARKKRASKEKPAA